MDLSISLPNTHLMQAFSTNPDQLEQPVDLLDDEGVTWRLRRKRIDLLIVHRLIKDKRATVLLGEGGGTRPRLVDGEERSMLWAKAKDAYMGPGGAWATGRYLAHEFHADVDRRMLYLEEHC